MGECFSWLKFVDAFSSLFAQAPIEGLWLRLAVGPQHSSCVVAQQPVAANPGDARSSAQPSASSPLPSTPMRASRWRWTFCSGPQLTNRCLLTLPSAQWGNAALCPGADPQTPTGRPQRCTGLATDPVGSLKHWGLEPCSGVGLMLRSPSLSWCCRNDARRSCRVCGDPWHQHPGGFAGLDPAPPKPQHQLP